MTSREASTLRAHLELAFVAVSDVPTHLLTPRMPVVERDQLLDLQIARDELLRAVNIIQQHLKL